MTDVQVGQVWRDADKRGYGRSVRVVELIRWRGPGHPDDGTGVPYAVVELVTGRGTGYDAAKPGRRTRIRLDRFKPTATGYRLVENAPEENK